SGVPEMFVLLPERTALPEAFLPAARDAGVRRVVLHSDRGLDVMGNDQLRTAEDAVRGSGLDWTIVRPDWFHQDFETFFAPPVIDGRLCLPVGAARQGFIDAGDIAAVEVAAFTGDSLLGQVLEVTGPRALSFGEALAEISRVTGREIVFDSDPGTFRAVLRADGVPDEVIETLLAGYAALRALGDTEPTGVVERILGRPGRDFADYAADAAARGVWDGTGGPATG
ncbi:MAG TPA: NAD(P)H-binding protein, partial [Actinoplanes sp.]|nr:NAD(P)H-binding protein [Actinoplanes sp.]